MKKNPSPIRLITEVGMLALTFRVMSFLRTKNSRRFRYIFVPMNQEPVVELLRRVGEAEDSQQKEGNGGQNQQHNADAA